MRLSITTLLFFMVGAFIVSSSYVAGQGIPNIHNLDFTKLWEAAPVAAFAAPAAALMLGSAAYSLFRTVGWAISVAGSTAIAILTMALFFKPQIQSLMVAKLR